VAVRRLSGLRRAIPFQIDKLLIFFKDFFTESIWQALAHLLLTFRCLSNN